MDSSGGLGEFLADRLLMQAAVRSLLSDADTVVAVPLYWWRQFSRGFNQSQVIAARLAKRSSRKLLRPLLRARDTQTQTKLSATRRRENMKDAFALISPKHVQGRRVVLVDDVKTSGATLQAAARALLPARPASIDAIVVAAADPRGRGFEAV